MSYESVYIGTELKFLIEIEADNFSMVDDNFTVDIVRGLNRQHFEKSDLVDEEYQEEDADHNTVTKHHYYVCFDTATLGAGTVYAIVTAYVPDMDFSDGLRTEVYKVELGKLIEVEAFKTSYGIIARG